MKIQELLTEDQLDEISMGSVGQGVGKVAGHAVGATKAAGRGLKNFWSGVKQGFDQGQSSWDDKTAPAGQQSAPAGQQGQQAAAAQPAPAQQQGQQPAPAQQQGQQASPTGQQTQAAPQQTQQPAAAGTLYSQLKSQIDQLDARGKKQVLTALQKALGSTPTAPAAKPNAMGQMANQLTGKQQSSTGGTTTQTPTGVTHTANPNNPNKQAATVEFRSKFLGTMI